MKINVIPNSAQGQLDIRRLPNETRQEVLARLRRIINDPAVDVAPAPDRKCPPPTEFAHHRSLQEDGRGISGVGAERRSDSVHAARRHRRVFLRQKGMAVYGIPAFLREDRVSRAHGNDERISVKSLESGTKLLWDIVLAVSR